MHSKTTPYDALMACRKAAGSDSQLARDLGIPQATMWRMLNQSKELRADLVLSAERLYGISRHDLRPDYYPRESMVDHHVADRFATLDLRTRSSADRSVMADRMVANGIR